MRTAIYTRVSTDFDKDDPRHQDCENQTAELEHFAASQGWKIVERYQDRISGTKGRDKRREFDRMLKDAAKRRFDILLVWAADRLSRQGPYETLDVVKRLSAYGVRFRSLQQPFLDTTNGFGEVLLALFGWMASEERRLISERTKAGLKRAVSKGRKLGRKPVSIDMDLLHAMRIQGSSLRKIAQAMGVSLATVHSLRSKKVSGTLQLSLASSNTEPASLAVS
jgi:DNA invertase Pin-like site-specific DNA recombinase